MPPHPRPSATGIPARPFADLFQPRRHASFAEIFLRDHIACNLAPGAGDFNFVQFENNRTIRIADFRRRQREIKVRIGVLAILGEFTVDLHWSTCPIFLNAPLWVAMITLAFASDGKVPNECAAQVKQKKPSPTAPIARPAALGWPQSASIRMVSPALGANTRYSGFPVGSHNLAHIWCLGQRLNLKKSDFVGIDLER